MSGRLNQTQSREPDSHCRPLALNASELLPANPIARRVGFGTYVVGRRGVSAAWPYRRCRAEASRRVAQSAPRTTIVTRSHREMRSVIALRDSCVATQGDT